MKQESDLDFSPGFIDALESIAGDPWTVEAKPLIRELPPAHPYPMKALMSLAPPARRAQEVIQAQDSICANSFLAAANLALQSTADLLIDGRRQPISLFLVSVAETGDRKSAVDRVALLPHRDWQKSQGGQYQRDKTIYDVQQKSYENAYRDIANRKDATPQEIEQAVYELQAPVEPLSPIIMMSEPTYEGIVKLLDQCYPSVGLFTDEGARFLGGHAMKDENQLKTAAGLSGLWDSGEADRVRSSEQARVLYGKRFAMHMMIQPDASQMLLSNRRLKDQGFLSRCLLARPNPPEQARQYQQVDLSVDPDVVSYSQRILAILNQPLTLSEGTRNELNPRTVLLSREAKALYIKYHNDLQKEVMIGGTLHPVRGFANKAHDIAARVAATLQLFDKPDAREISAEHFNSACEIVGHSIGELLRLVDVFDEDEDDLYLAKEVLTWLKSRNQELVSLVELYKNGPRRIRSVKRARAIMDTLRQHGYARPSAHSLDFGGILRRETFEVRFV